ncbi:hypothetical protein EDM80_05935 [bacterium]|nr:MAG: hypothetical protein EDM80_05935 [bacterium]RIK63712.1 MAG: hypothetical protein DCC64_06245 [Planctomycetota bacterium]
MSEQTNIYIDGELAGTINDLKRDDPWHYGILVPGDAFEELKKSLDVAPYAKDSPGVTELVARQDTVERVSWGADLESSAMIEKLTLAQYGEGEPWELEFTTAQDSEAGAEAEEAANGAN